METTTKQSPDEATKQLFRQLFEAQCEFERYSDDSDPQVLIIVSMIDQLLEKIIEQRCD